MKYSFIKENSNYNNTNYNVNSNRNNNFKINKKNLFEYDQFDDDEDDDEKYEKELKKEFTRKLEDGIRLNYINAKAVKRYLDNGADINIVTDDGSLLNKAISNREPEIVKVLLDYGIKVDDEALRTLDYFIEENKELGKHYEEDYVIKKMLEPYR